MSVGAVSCREGDIAPASPEPLPVRVKFAVGSRYVYETWALNEYGSRIVSSKGSSLWHVAATDTQVLGRGGVVVVVDSAASLNNPSVSVNTLYFSVSPNGDIYWYGFLSGLVHRRGGRDIPPRWDLVAAFSRGSRSSWEVGVTDSVNGQTVTGWISGDQQLFTVAVNGIQTIFPAYRVDLNQPDLEYSFWVADDPSSFLHIHEAATPSSLGRLQDLTQMTIAFP